MIITISAAFIMGIAGSLHCLGMCGPLVSALETMSTPNRWRYSQWLHHGGRWLTYAALGAIAGALGQTFAAIGFQRLTVILAGILMLLLAFIPTLGHVGLKPAQRITSAVKKQFSKMMHAQHPVFRLLLGILHGLLPCGLVYTAMATAMATTSIAQGTLFMFIFGIATTPALIAVSRVMHWLKQYFHMRSIKHIQGTLMILALLVILRGSNLGIPLLSPKVNTSKAQMECCHR